MRVWSRLFAGLLALCLGASGSAWAQGFQGGVRGAIKDSGGVIPGAEVVLVNENLGTSRSTVTNERGEYNFPNLDPGTYTLKASLQGYKTYEQKGLRVGTQQFITLDVTLEVGELQETITVTGAAPLIETSNASTGEVLDSQELQTLPSGGRSAFLIGVTVPTVVATGDAQWNRQQDQTNASLVSLGGGARRANNYILDGVPISDMRNRSVVNPTIEGIEEVKVQVHTFDAEMGRTGGGVFNTTAKSGTNEFRGTGFFQTRPVWGMENNYFSERAGIPKPTDLFYRLYGGGFGGPIVKNRTFFHFATEGYRSVTTRNGALIFPTDRERAGDFSQTFDRNGNLVVIHNPFDPTRAPFPGNVIPADLMDTVGRNIVNLMPRADVQVSDGSANYNRTASIQDAADQFMFKGDHKFSDKVSLSGVYLYNKSDEPYSVYWDDNLYQDPNAAPLKRRIHVGVVNNTWIPNSSTVVSLRYGQTSFVDDCGIAITEFDPASLGFDPSFTNDIVLKKHPRINLDGYGEIGTNTIGSGAFTAIDWNSWGVNGAASKLMGSHTVKAGADYRWIGVVTTPFGQGSGTFSFTRGFTASPSGVGGNALASLLLGVPRGNDSSSAVIAATSEYYTNYYGAYVQDDWRIKPNFTVNYGIRLEREDGLRERNNQFTVGFDQSVLSPISGSAPGLAAIRGSNELRGGLMYAGVDGNNDYQGNPPGVKVSPRVGAVWSLNPKTVLRGGYGMFWAPWNYQFPSTVNYGNIGYSQTTFLQQSSETGVPTTRLSNPFPGGLLDPSGNSLGLLTGIGGEVNTIDQNKGAPRVQQLSADMQYELTDSIAVSVGYAHARGDDLSLGGTNDAIVNINQIRPDVAANYTPAQLLESVPNPFFGLAQFGAFSRSATIARGQLLRPFPQFGNVNIRQVTEGRSRYNALILKLDKRVSDGWGGRFNYTWSNLKDNQFGESNYYQSNRTSAPQDNYNLEAEYATSLLDMPHRFVFTPIVELPFGQGKKWGTGPVADALIGGWAFSATVMLESGFPQPTRYSQSTTQTALGNFGNGELRPNAVNGDPNTEGSWDERVTSADPWADREGYAQPARGQFGTMERTDTRIRSPFRKNLDFAFNKSFRTGGNTHAELRVEVLNATNTPKFTAYEVRLDQPNYGLITSQAGFSRITQVMMRFSF
jgi:trimeric autotransporter adhesin